VFAVSPADRPDAPAIANLMEELDRFYGVTDVDPLQTRVTQIEDMLFGLTPAAHVLLARRNDHLVGLAAYSYLWPAAGLTQSLYLKELYVRQSHHRQGIGTALMRAVCDEAVKTGCSRVEWTTENTNTSAMQFYSDLGVTLNTGKVFYRLDAEAIKRILNA
jgi:GNAT superfamily N-acetyltransferase